VIAYLIEKIGSKLTEIQRKKVKIKIVCFLTHDVYRVNIFFAFFFEGRFFQKRGRNISFRFSAFRPAVVFNLIKPEVRQYRNESISAVGKTCL